MAEREESARAATALLALASDAIARRALDEARVITHGVALLAEAAGLGATAALAHKTEARVHHLGEDMTAARASFSRAVEVERAIGDTYAALRTEIAVAFTHYDEGDGAAASAMLDDVERRAGEHLSRLRPQLSGYRGNLARQREDHAEAHHLYADAISSAFAQGDALFAHVFAMDDGITTLLEGDAHAALASLDRTMEAVTALPPNDGKTVLTATLRHYLTLVRLALGVPVDDVTEGPPSASLRAMRETLARARSGISLGELEEVGLRSEHARITRTLIERITRARSEQARVIVQRDGRFVVCGDGRVDLSQRQALRRDADEANGTPGGREYFAWWLADDERALYLYGGFSYVPRQFTPTTTLFRFDLATSLWSSVPLEGEAPGPGARVALDGAGRPHLFGGAGIAANGALETPPSFGAIDASASGASLETLPSTGALGSYTGSLVYDTRRERWLSVCGVDAGVGPHCQVHAFTAEGRWQRINSSLERPSGRYGFHYVYDEATDRVIVFAGQVGADNLDIDGETWALDLEPNEAGTLTWTQLETPTEISRRRNGAYALDPEGHRMFVWGGTPDGADSVPGIDVLSLERGREVWTHLEPEGAPPSRTSAQGVYDPTTHSILWGMGNDDAVYTDLWSLALTPREGT